jgi:hypothetical protein
MPIALLLLIALTAGLAIGATVMSRRHQNLRREQFIRSHVFSLALLDGLRKTHPALTEKDEFLVARALRSFFLIHLRTAPAGIGMPSRVVDDLWHEFILDTREYSAFCDQAFGAYFHHIPAAKMTAGISRDAGMRRTWRHACLEENINPEHPTRLPLLFAIDQKLAISDGNVYSLEKPIQTSASSCGSACGGFACSGGGLSECDSADSSASDSGGDSSCGGGGCGGD